MVKTFLIWRRKRMFTPDPFKILGAPPSTDERYISCSECNGVAERTVWLNNGHWTFRCKRCGALIGDPTEWALCSMRGIIFKTPHWCSCWACDFYVRMKVTYDPQGSRPCPKFARLLKFDEVYNSPWFKEKQLKIIEV